MTRITAAGVVLAFCAMQVSCVSIVAQPSFGSEEIRRTALDLPQLRPVLANVVEAEWPLGVPKSAFRDQVLMVQSVLPAYREFDLVFSEADELRSKLFWSFVGLRGQRRLISIRRVGQVAEVSVEYVDDYGRFVGCIDAASSRIYRDDDLLVFDIMVSRGTETAMRERWIGCARWAQMKPLSPTASAH